MVRIFHVVCHCALTTCQVLAIMKNYVVTMNCFVDIGPPVLLVPPQNTVVQVGNATRLSCLFLANPNDGRIHWQWRNGNSLEDLICSEMYHILPNGTLIITRTTDANTGEYQCTVSNSKGQITGKANLTVLSKLLAS